MNNGMKTLLAGACLLLPMVSAQADTPYQTQETTITNAYNQIVNTDQPALVQSIQDTYSNIGLKSPSNYPIPSSGSSDVKKTTLPSLPNAYDNKQGTGIPNAYEQQRQSQQLQPQQLQQQQPSNFDTDKPSDATKKPAPLTGFGDGNSNGNSNGNNDWPY